MRAEGRLASWLMFRAMDRLGLGVGRLGDLYVRWKSRIPRLLRVMSGNIEILTALELHSGHLCGGTSVSDSPDYRTN